MIQIQRVHRLQALLALLLALHSASPACGRAIQTPNTKITGKALQTGSDVASSCLLTADH